MRLRRGTRNVTGMPRWEVRDAHVVHGDGSVSAVIVTGELDVASLDAARRGAAVAAFARLCHTIDAPLQIVVRIRRAQDAAAAADASHPALDAAMRAHWRKHIEQVRPMTRSVMLVTRAATTAELEAQVERIVAATRAIGVGGTRVSGDDLARAITSERDAHSDVVWSSTPQHAEVGGTFVRALVLRRLPGSTVDAGWLAPLLDVPVECDIALHLAPLPLADALRTLGRYLRDASAHQLVETERGALSDVHVSHALGAAHALRARLARTHSRPLELSLTAVARAATPHDLQAAGVAVRDAFRATLATCEWAHFRHHAAYLTALPLARDELRSVKLVEAGAAATCMPWTHAGCNDSDGYRIGMALRSRLPVRVAPFDAALHGNANIAVFAASGHGKSFALGTLVLEAAAHGAAAVIVDPEGEYERVVDAVRGQYWRVTPGSPLALNVFDAAQDDDEAAAAVIDLVAVMCGGVLDDGRRAAVDDATRHAQRQAAQMGRRPLLGDCLVPLRKCAPDVAAVVARYCGGSLGALFNAPTSLRLGADVTAVSLVDLPDEHVPAMTLLLARWLWALIRHDRRRRHIVFDEVGALSVDAPLRALLVQLARRCRKYGASLVVATQNAQDLLATEEGRVVATNCATLLLGGHRPAETARMQEAFGLTPGQRRFVETAARGEFLLMAGERRVEMRVEVPDLHRRILSRTP